MNYPGTISQEEWEQIEKYLIGELSIQEQEEFDHALSNDPTLEAKVNEVRLLITGVKESSLQHKLDQFHGEIQPQRVIALKKKPVIKYWLAAACLLGLVVTVSLFMLNRKSENDKIFASYFQADPGLATAMGSSEDYEFDHAMIDYKRGNNELAIRSWRNLLALRPGNDTLHYFSGVAFLAMDQPDSAIYHLQESVKKENSSFLSDANWYLALSLVRKNDIPGARTYLQRSDHLRKNELLSRLKQ